MAAFDIVGKFLAHPQTVELIWQSERVVKFLVSYI